MRGQPRSYTTAHIVTTGSFTYGAFELRAKAPNNGSASPGLWPSFWLGAADGIGAIDVAAFYGSSGYASASQAVYCATTQQSSYAVAGGAAGDFHTYRLEWGVRRPALVHRRLLGLDARCLHHTRLRDLLRQAVPAESELPGRRIGW